MWMYQGNEVVELPDDCVGFVYLIVNTKTNKKYIGKKLSKFSRTKYQTVTLKNGTKKKKKIRSKIDSDWKDYYGSSDQLNKDIEELGKGFFTREIIYLCNSKAMCSYLEAKLQFRYEVLESDDWYNGNIMVRVHGNHIKGKLYDNI